MLLTSANKGKAVAFIAIEARPLERARYAYLFEKASAEHVLAELQSYQNADGGFGHGLESDFRLQESSAICSSIALQYLREVKAPVDHPLVVNAVRYLLATYDDTLRAWPIIPANDNSAPHAPWWNYSANIAESWNHYQANPRAEIVAHLYAYTQLLPAGWLDSLGESLLSWLADRETLEMHDLLCFLRLLESEEIPQAIRQQLLTHLTPCVESAVVLDPAQWAGYCLQPLQVVSSPESAFFEMFADAVSSNLDYLIARQTPDGCWPTSWGWGTFPEIWPLAEREWQGALTLDALRTLKAFGRIEV